MNCKADIWYGDTEIADVVNQAGIYNHDEQYNTGKMFDENPSTFWQSPICRKYWYKIFKNGIYEKYLVHGRKEMEQNSSIDSVTG